MQDIYAIGELARRPARTMARRLDNPMPRTALFLLATKSLRSGRGFTLVELLTVLGIMAILFGMTVSAIPGFRSTYNRKSAVDNIMSTIEQARIAALQSGENAYVVLALAQDGGVSPDAMIVAGDPPIGAASTAEIFYTHWIRLPQNIRFLSKGNGGAGAGTLAANIGIPSGVPLSLAGSGTTTKLPMISGNPELVVFTFSSTGTLAYPPSGAGPNGGLDLALFEGTRNNRGNETALGPSAKATSGLSASGFYDVIRMDRYSGRSWADVSTLSQK